jgi:uncharacterized protein
MTYIVIIDTAPISRYQTQMLQYLQYKFIILLVALFAQISAQPIQSIPPLTGRVVDLTNTILPKQKDSIENVLADAELQKGRQIAVLIVPTTKPETMEQYSIRVAENWKIGRKGNDDGVLLIIALQDKEVRIEVGYGLEGDLPDITCKRIIETNVVPYFKIKEYEKGIEAGITEIISVVNGKVTQTKDNKNAKGQYETTNKKDSNFPIVLGIVLIVIGWIAANKLGRLIGLLVGGILSFFIAWPITKSIPESIVMSIFVVFAVSLSFLGGKNASKGKSSFGSKTSSHSSGSKFSGKGGSFGGGGASGKW